MTDGYDDQLLPLYNSAVSHDLNQSTQEVVRPRQSFNAFGYDNLNSKGDKSEADDDFDDVTYT
jgi:hypothetical protein